MKPEIKAPDKTVKFYSSLSKKERAYIKHALSPLQLAACRHNFEPFNYKIDGEFVYISVYACKQLLSDTRYQVSFLTNQLDKEDLCKAVPREHREAFEDPRQILSLPTYLRNKLCKQECYTMVRIMMLGRAYFENHKEFGPKSLKTMVGLFEKYKCGHLFK